MSKIDRVDAWLRKGVGGFGFDGREDELCELVGVVLGRGQDRSEELEEVCPKRQPRSKATSLGPTRHLEGILQ